MTKLQFFESNLQQYRTAGDGKVRPEHAGLNGVTLPMDDGFWDHYYPPNGWNFRCTVVQVLRTDNVPTDREEALRRAKNALRGDKKGMFRFNPGKERRTFPAYNPYTISKCRNCDQSKLNLAFIPDNEVCQACQFIKKCYVGDEIVESIGNGTVRISRLIDKDSPDYHKVKQVAEFFASQGADVEMTPKMSRPSAFLYDCYYKDLRGTKYENKCPDLRINGVWYEHEGFITKDPVKAFNNMLNHGLKQSSRIIIDQPELSDAFIKKAIGRRIFTAGQVIDEVWIRSESGVRPLYKQSEEH